MKPALDIPPGYLDKNKEWTKYGDWLVWKQLLNKAQQNPPSFLPQLGPIVFVTKENKNDWWIKDEETLLGARRELVEEMREVADQPFYLLSFEMFLEMSMVHAEGPPKLTEEDLIVIKQEALCRSEMRSWPVVDEATKVLLAGRIVQWSENHDSMAALESDLKKILSHERDVNAVLSLAWDSDRRNRLHAALENIQEMIDRKK